MPDLKPYETAVARAARWLVGQQNPDGSIEPVEAGLACYHKVPYALSLAGEIAAAARLLDWVRDNDLCDTGDLGARYDRLPPYEKQWATPNAWVICAAQRTGQFDISELGLEYLIARLKSDGGWGDPEGTAWVGLAFLQAGALDMARAALERLIESMSTGQPSGAAATFLVRLCRAAVSERYLAAAIVALEPAVQAASAPLDANRAELGRAAALFSGMTADPDYERLATTVADQVVAQQREDGSWRLSGGDEPHRIVDFTAESAVALGEMIEGLAMGRRG